MGEVEPGTVVLDHRGLPTTVTGVSPVEVKPCYRVTFDDGSSIIASDDHLWTVLDRLARHSLPESVDWAVETWDATAGRPRCSVPGCDRPTRKGTICSAHAERKRKGLSGDPGYRWKATPGAPRKAQVMTTADLLAAGLRDGQERRWAIPVAEAFDGDDPALPVHPYVLGAWLGDGATDGAIVTVGDEDVEAMHANLEACGIEVRRYPRSSGYSLSLVNGTRVALRAAGVLGDKHIPRAYLRASRAARMDLLRGLLDTDGTVIRRGRAAEFVTTRETLANGVRELGHSLGYRVTVGEGRAKLRGKDCGPLWRLRIAGITPDVFALPRKRDLAQRYSETAHRNTGRLRYIESIERAEDRPVKCIVVDSPGHLFLAGESWVPTHNSTTVELACAWLGSQPSPARRFVLYVSETQAQADKHVQAIAGMLERVGIGRAMNEYGQSRGWRRQELRAETGFNVVAFGLDSGMRGVKLDEFRPDLIVMDDVDGRHDSDRTTEKKIETITETILPSGSVDVAVVVVQNKIHKTSIVSRLADGTADFLYDRHVATVEPAVEGLEYVQRTQADGTVRYQITAGTPTWAGQDLATCERQLNEWGIAAFEREAQHNVDRAEGGLWDLGRDIIPFRVPGPVLPGRIAFRGITVGVDPNAGEGGDEAGIVVAGAAYQVYNPSLDQYEWSPDLHGYTLADRTVAGGPRAWAEAAVRAYHDYRAYAPGKTKLVAEKNHGGTMVEVTISTVPGAPAVHLVNASLGKLTRAEPVQVLYERGLIHHAGTFPDLEAEMGSWSPGDPSPNRMDALTWAYTDLLLDGVQGLEGLQRYYDRQLGRSR